MSMKLHFLFSHLDYFPENVGAFSEEMGERFHQDFKHKERHYQDKWKESMMAPIAGLYKEKTYQLIIS